MKRIIYFSIAALSFYFLTSAVSYAVCVENPPDKWVCDDNPPNPDLNGIDEFANPNSIMVNVLPGAGIDTSAGGDAILTGVEMDMVDVDGGTIEADEDGINTSVDQDQVTVKDSTITAGEDGINTSTDNDIVTVINSTITGDDRGIDTSTGIDNVSVSGSTIRGINEMGINTSTDIDQLTITDSIIIGDTEAVQLGTNNDTITLGTGADLRGIINCDTEFEDDWDMNRIIFAMEVPEELLNSLAVEIAQASVPDGSITINGLFYEWINCDILVNELVGVRNPRPIPTLSEWGLIAMAGALGIFGIIYMMRRRHTA